MYVYVARVVIAGKGQKREFTDRDSARKWLDTFPADQRQPVSREYKEIRYDGGRERWGNE